MMFSVSYLSWVKNLDQEISSRRQSHPGQCFDFSGSAVRANEEEFLNALVKLDLTNRTTYEHPPPPFDVNVPWGHPALVKAISERYDVQSDQILLTSGASLAMFLTCRALLLPGDKALVEWPTYEPFLAAAEAASAGTVPFRRDPVTFDLNPTQLRRSLSDDPRIKVLLMSNPHNPSGVLLSEERIIDLAAVAEQFSVPMIVDEVFLDLAGPKSTPAARLHKNVISLNSLSKVYGLSRLRCAWILAEPRMLSQMRETQIAVENIGSQLTQAIASLLVSRLDALRHHALTVVQNNYEAFSTSARRLIGEGLVEGSPQPCASIYFPRLRRVSHVDSFVSNLRERGVFAVPGKYFQAAGHIRLGFGGFADVADIQSGMQIFEEELRKSSLA